MNINISDKELLKTGAFINGEWIDSDDHSFYSVTNPATGEIIADVARCGEKETNRAIEAAEAARDSWSKLTIKERASILRKWLIYSN